MVYIIFTDSHCQQFMLDQDTTGPCTGQMGYFREQYTEQRLFRESSAIFQNYLYPSIPILKIAKLLDLRIFMLSHIWGSLVASSNAFLFFLLLLIANKVACFKQMINFLKMPVSKILSRGRGEVPARGPWTIYCAFPLLSTTLFEKQNMV